MTALEIDEIYVDLAYGRIRGKWWGSRQQRPVLLLHGWQDNAGSFDTLIPLLPPEFSYLALDLPGHGFSSHLPKGMLYHTVDLVPLLEEIRLKFKWERLSVICHSMSAVASFFYTMLFQDRVDLICALDTLKMQHNHSQLTKHVYSTHTKKSIELVSSPKSGCPEYTYNELVERVYEGSMKSVNRDKAKYLIERGTRPSLSDPNKITITRDVRVRFMQPFYAEQTVSLEYIKQIQVPYLFIKGEFCKHFSEPEQNVREAVELFQKTNKQFEYFRVRGTHHFHLNQPEAIAGKIGEFLKKYYIEEEQKQVVKVISKL